MCGGRSQLEQEARLLEHAETGENGGGVTAGLGGFLRDEIGHRQRSARLMTPRSDTDPAVGGERHVTDLSGELLEMKIVFVGGDGKHEIAHEGLRATGGREHGGDEEIHARGANFERFEAPGQEGPGIEAKINRPGSGEGLGECGRRQAYVVDEHPA